VEREVFIAVDCVSMNTVCTLVGYSKYRTPKDLSIATCKNSITYI